MPSNRVMGRALIDGRAVVVTADDFTVRGGSADATIAEKAVFAEQMANELRLPIIRVIEGSGGGGSVKTIETTGRANLPGGIGHSQKIFQLMTENLSVVPVVSLGLGSVAGLGAALVAASHYSVMTKTTSAMFVAGPPVVARIGDKTEPEKQALGGWEIQTRAGAVDDAVETEDEAFAAARRFLSYLPSSVHALPPRGPRSDPPSRREEMLISAVPRDRSQPYKMRPIVEALFDKGSFFETGRYFGRGLVTGLARLEGLPVAVMASDPFHSAGCWTADVCQKVVRFVDLAETFHLPVVYLADCPGFMIGLEAEKNRHHPPRRARHGRDQPDPPCPGARSSCETSSASPASRTYRPAVSRCVTPGPRPGGARCRSKAASRPPIAPRSTPRRTRRPSLPRSRRGSTRCARRCALPKRSGSRKSSIRATRASCCANSLRSPRRC